MHTYEGTYEVNSLVSGRELTGGISAIRWYADLFLFRI
jgi:hypothetical protein